PNYHRSPRVPRSYFPGATDEWLLLSPQVFRNSVLLAQPLVLELREQLAVHQLAEVAAPIVGAAGELLGPTDVFELRLCVHELVDPLGVVRVIGGDVQDATRAQPAGDEVQRAGLHDAALVVAGLGPRVREEDAHPGQGLGPEHALQHLHAVALDHADVLDPFAAHRADQLGQAGAVELDG